MTMRFPLSALRRACFRALPPFVALLAALAPVRADEGQWPPDQLGGLDWDALRARGLELSATDIWGENGTGLAQAVINLEGCSASFISPDGLAISNHHCAYGLIQEHSTAQHDYITDGYVARSRDQELPGKGQRILVLRDFEDVTAKIKPAADAAKDDLARQKVVERLQKELTAACEKKPATRCRVGSYFGGLRYVLFESMEIKDIRLVYAPPNGVGDFGGEVDNWQWPRHTGDFSMVRAYVAPDGSSAEYSPGNVPFRPKRWLPISTRGIRPGELVMVMGYPGRTERWLPASAVKRDLEWFYPARERFTRELKQVLEEAGKDDRETEIRAAATVKGLANALGNAHGMLAGLRRNGTVAAREKRDAELRAWVAADPARAARFGKVIDELEAFYEADRATRDRDFLLGQLSRGSKPLAAAATLLRFSREQKKADLEREPGYQERDRERLRAGLERMQKDYDPRADRAAFRYVLGRLLELPEGQRIAALDALVPGGAKGVEAFLDRFYAGTKLTEAKERLALFAAPRTALDASTDAALALARALEPEIDAAERREKERAGAVARLRPLYSEALIAWRGGRIYPDANSTLRISFASVQGYDPKDGVAAKPQTTLEGILQKHTGEEPFDAPDRLLDAARRRDHGRWAQADLGTVPVDFLSNADTTGGNSGSPVVNGKGELVGLNFDRVFENVAGDYGWSPVYSRNISVDVRFLLWMLDRVEGAGWLLQEMGVPPAN